MAKDKIKNLVSLAVIIVFSGVIYLLVNSYKTEDSIKWSSYEDGNIYFQFDSKVKVIPLDNPVYGDDSDYTWLGIGERGSTESYETEIEFGSASGWVDEDISSLPINIKIEGRQAFGSNIFAVYTDTSSNRKCFQSYKNGYSLSVCTDENKAEPAYVLMSSFAIKDSLDEQNPGEIKPFDAGKAESYLSGTITSRDDGCFSDGLCLIELDNRIWIIYAMGWTPTKGVVEGDLSIGNKVQAYAEKYNGESQYKNVYSVIGDQNYYLKVVK